MVPETIPILLCCSVRDPLSELILLPKYTKSCTPCTVWFPTIIYAAGGPAPIFAPRFLPMRCKDPEQNRRPSYVVGCLPERSGCCPFWQYHRRSRCLSRGGMGPRDLSGRTSSPVSNPRPDRIKLGQVHSPIYNARPSRERMERRLPTRAWELLPW